MQLTSNLSCACLPPNYTMTKKGAGIVMVRIPWSQGMDLPYAGVLPATFDNGDPAPAGQVATILVLLRYGLIGFCHRFSSASWVTKRFV